MCDGNYVNLMAEACSSLHRALYDSKNRIKHQREIGPDQRQNGQSYEFSRNQRSSAKVEADGSLLPVSYWELQMLVFSWFVSSDSAIMIAPVTSHQRESFNMLNCKLYSSFCKALRECGVTPVYPQLPVSYGIRCNVHSVPM